MDKVKDWVDKNPLLTGGIVFGVGLIILWWLGYFSSSSSSNSSASNMAAAYYAAEAAQTTAGTQLQLATVAATNQTAQVGLQASAATAINQANQDAAVKINGQNASATTTLGQYGLFATQSNNATALGAVQSNNGTAAQMQAEHDQAMNLSTLLNSVLPQELALTGGVGAVSLSPGGAAVSAGYSSPNALAAQGFSPSQISALLGVG